MAHPLVVHCKHDRRDVDIGRRSKSGNPFEIGRDGDRAQVLARYERWLTGVYREFVRKTGIRSPRRRRSGYRIAWKPALSPTAQLVEASSSRSNRPSEERAAVGDFKTHYRRCGWSRVAL